MLCAYRHAGTWKHRPLCSQGSSTCAAKLAVRLPHCAHIAACRNCIIMGLQVENMPAEEFDALWQRYISAYAELLLEASPEAAADCPAVQRLVRLLLSRCMDHAIICACVIV
jgi:hypothetical protein